MIGFSAIGRSLSRLGFWGKKYSPELLMGAGTLAVGAGVVMACVATTKLKEATKAEVEEIDAIIKTRKSESEENYSKKQYKSELLMGQVKLAMKIAQLYLPAISTITLGVGCFFGAHGIMKRRNLALAAALTVVERSFEAYRQRVIAKYGEAEDRELRFGKNPSESVRNEEGEIVTSDDGEPLIEGNSEAVSLYARYFDKHNYNWHPNKNLNDAFISSKLNTANAVLRNNGYLFLNDVYKLLGFDETPEGQVVGWLWDGDHDGIVDFDCYREDGEFQSWIENPEESVLLDFNVDGNIIDKFKLANRTVKADRLLKETRVESAISAEQAKAESPFRKKRV